MLEDAEELELLDTGCEELADEELLAELELAGKLLEAELDAILEELVGVLEEELDATLEELAGTLDELTASLELAGTLDAMLELDGMLLDAEELLTSLETALLATLEDAGAPLTPQPVRIMAAMTDDAAMTETPRKRPCFNLILISPFLTP